MRLYLISPKVGVRMASECYQEAVVAAASAAAARKTHPSGDAWSNFGGSWVDTPDKVLAEFIGTAKLGTNPGVICANYYGT